MNILYVLKRYPRLSETFIVRELLGIEALGVSVGIDALLAPEDEPRHPEVGQVRAAVRYLPRRPGWRGDRLAVALAGLLVAHPIQVCRAAGSAWAAQRAGDPRALRRWSQAVLVADRCRRDRVEVIHAHFATGAAQVAVPAGRMAGVPVTVTAHAKDIFHVANATGLPARLAGAATVVTVSEFNAAHLRAVLPGIPVVHIANGVALGPLAGPCVGTWGAPVLVVSRLVPKKGIDTLLDAVARGALADPQLTLEIVGGGPLRDELVARAERLGLTDRVRFLGPVPSDRVEAAYARCSLVALPCRIDADGDRDGLPTVLVEALARGIPVVSTDVVGIPELVRHGETGLLVEPDDAEALAAAIDTLRSDPAAARAMGLAGRELVAARYDPAGSARASVALWRDLSGRAR